MATETIKRQITICGNWRQGGPDNEWAGTGTVDRHGSIECSAVLGEEAYDLIEEQISDGDTSGTVTVGSGEGDGREITYHWEITDPAQEIGQRIGAAMARDTKAEGMPMGWTGLGDQATAAGIEPNTDEWERMEAAAKAEFERIMGE